MTLEECIKKDKTSIEDHQNVIVMIRATYNNGLHQ